MPTLKTQKRTLKSRAMSLVRDLPKDSSWDDLMYRIYVRQKIEAGLADLRGGCLGFRFHSVRSSSQSVRPESITSRLKRGKSII